MIVRLALAAAFLCVLAVPSFACDAMRPCFADGRLLYGSLPLNPGTNGHSRRPKAAGTQGQRRATASVTSVSSRYRVSPDLARVMSEGAGRIVSHPSGCPRVAFCACGALKRLSQVWGVNFKNPRSLWLAANWFRFPRTSPAPGTVAVRKHHVFVLEHHIGGSVWQVYDANSGGRRTRIHARSIAGYVIVQPRA